MTEFVTSLLRVICKRLAILIQSAHLLLSVKLDATSSGAATRKSAMSSKLREIICANRKFSGPLYSNDSSSELPQLWHSVFRILQASVIGPT
jgi:predicted solute-binding protein